MNESPDCTLHKEQGRQNSVNVRMSLILNDPLRLRFYNQQMFHSYFQQHRVQQRLRWQRLSGRVRHAATPEVVDEGHRKLVR